MENDDQSQDAGVPYFRAIRQDINIYKKWPEYAYIYIYGAMVATSCDLTAPRCTTKAPQLRLHGSRGGVFVDHRPPRDPGDPLR